MSEQTSELLDLDDPKGPQPLNPHFDPAAETRWWMWLSLLVIVFSGLIMFGIIYLVATGRKQA